MPAASGDRSEIPRRARARARARARGRRQTADSRLRRLHHFSFQFFKPNGSLSASSLSSKNKWFRPEKAAPPSRPHPLIESHPHSRAATGLSISDREPSSRILPFPTTPRRHFPKARENLTLAACSWRVPCPRFSAGAIGWWGSLVVLASSYLWLVFLLQRASSPALVDSRIPSSTFRAPPRPERESGDSTVSSANAGA
jgi:hypothetical protein